MTGWIHVREGDEGEVPEGAYAHAASLYYFDPHGIKSRWSHSEIVWHPENARDLDEDFFEEVLVHELGVCAAGDSRNPGGLRRAARCHGVLRRSSSR